MFFGGLPGSYRVLSPQTYISLDLRLAQQKLFFYRWKFEKHLKLDDLTKKKGQCLCTQSFMQPLDNASKI